MVLIDAYYRLEAGTYYDFTPRIKDFSLAGLGCLGDDGELVFSNLPPGLAVSGTGVGLLGIPTKAGSYLARVQVVGNDCSTQVLYGDWDLRIDVGQSPELFPQCLVSTTVQAIWLKEISDFFDINNLVSGVLGIDLSTWYRTSMAEYMEYTEDSQGQNVQGFVNWQLAFELPRASEEQREWLDTMRAKKGLAVVMELSDGTYKMVGAFGAEERGLLNYKREVKDRSTMYKVQVNGAARRTVQVYPA
jgi:hypothetical protein